MSALLSGKAFCNDILDTSQNTRIAAVSPYATIDRGWFERASWCRPFWSELQSTNTTGEVMVATNNKAYDWTYLAHPDLVQNGDYRSAKYRPYVVANVGISVPVWSGIFENYGLSITIPYSVTLWMDAFDGVITGDYGISTGAVINTDYHIGTLEFNFIHYLARPQWGIKNYSLKVVPYIHESTHIGDELVLARYKANYPVTRVNVSFESWKVEGTINDPDFSRDRYHSLRVGILGSYSARYKGWYRAPNPDEELEGDAQLVLPSNIPIEVWAQYQFQSQMKPQSRIQWIASAEVRGRARYRYPLGEWDKDTPYSQPDKMYPNVNVMIGARYRHPKSPRFRCIGFGLHGFWGVNPYGHFRAMKNYGQLGLSLIVE
ncbi:hypothetical protein AGMMS4956_03870 [Bacteroidia bacterium]|nr:hypothetical protein AGMMS4956_03870 [Bacteroidia bacterium]